MDFLYWGLIVVLVGQIVAAGLLRGIIGLVVWTIVWVVVAFVHNLFAADENAWHYFSFWGGLLSWSGEMSDYIHLNIGVGIGNLLALVNSDESAGDDADTTTE